MTDSAYRKLAQRLDELPEGFPPTEDGAELRLLETIFTPQEASLAAELHLGLEGSEAIASRLGQPADTVRDTLRSMAKRGLIEAGRTEGGLGFGLMPFVVGIYEAQAGRIDQELAARFEAYYKQSFVETVRVEPSFHRVLPVQETIGVEMEVRPFESIAELVDQAQAWGVVDCICRKQKQLIGEGCEHPLDVCMVLSPTKGAFDASSSIRTLDREGAHATLQRAAEAGLVHTVGNRQEGHWYICNCCTCSCGILRGLKEFGVANVVARSPFVNTIEETLCVGCELCVEWCQFDALTHDDIAAVDADKCVGCGVCVMHCPEGAMELIRRPTGEYPIPPTTLDDWRLDRAHARGIDLDTVL
ncbi:MAG: 4Fe-4S binding protein [Anaerolineales bacterium]|jgi:electron transport complex protein RnfB